MPVIPWTRWTVCLSFALAAAAAPLCVAAEPSAPAPAGANAAPLRLDGLPPAQSVPAITIECSGAPDLAGFAAGARARCEAYYKPFAQYLASDGFTPPTRFTFTFEETDGVAGTSGTHVTFAAQYFRQHPDDYGAAIHEMVHIIQSYHGGHNPGWLVEGVADYMRFYKYEQPAARPHPDPDRTSYKNGYREAAAFLAWISDTYNGDLVPHLNAAMRQGVYSDAIWQKETGRTLDALWTEYLAALRKGR